MEIDYNELHKKAEEQRAEKEEANKIELKRIQDNKIKEQSKLNSLLNKVDESIKDERAAARAKEIEEAKAKAEREVEETINKKYNTSNQEAYKDVVNNIFKK